MDHYRSRQQRNAPWMPSAGKVRRLPQTRAYRSLSKVWQEDLLSFPLVTPLSLERPTELGSSPTFRRLEQRGVSEAGPKANYQFAPRPDRTDRKSTRLNSSHR